MITYLIVTLIVTAVIVSLHFMKPTKKHRTTSSMNAVKENPGLQDMKGLFDLMQQMNEDGNAEDIIPQGYGEFGYDLTNPIPVNTTFGIKSYLSKLKTMENEKVSYERIGSFFSPVSNHPVDRYKISVNGKELTTLYISCYHKKNSNKAPKHFKF